jgi:hypothetical protein
MAGTDYDLTENDWDVIHRIVAMSPGVWNAPEPVRTVLQCGVPIFGPWPPPRRFVRRGVRRRTMHAG